MKAFDWDSAKFGEMNFENICRLYSSDKSIKFSQNPPFIRSFYAIKRKKKYAVRWNKYDSRASFVGGSYGSDYFVLQGKSQIKIDGKIFNLNTGKYYKIPKCEFEFNVISDESFECIAVYKLNDNFQIPDLSEKWQRF